MPIQDLHSKIEYPTWANNRYRQLDLYQRFLAGKQYDHIQNPFYHETDSVGHYIPLRDRRPSVVYGLPKIVVTRSTRLLFGDKHFPKLVTTDTGVSEFLQSIADRSCLQAVMLEAAQVGSIGSVAVVIKVIDNEFSFDVLNSMWCAPIFDAKDQLKELFVKYPVYGYELLAAGYTLKDPEDENKSFFFARRYTADEEIRYQPLHVEDWEGDSSFVRDDDRSTKHGLGLVPAVWIKNLFPTVGMDGSCTFSDILAMSMELDYQLSQCGRGLKYNSDPQLLIKEPSGSEDASSAGYGGAAVPTVRSASNALFVGEKGDAKLLEISGQGQKAVLDYCAQLRQWALEVVSASRKDPEHAYGNMSGRAMEILDGDLINLTAALRLTYGELGLKPLCMKILRIAKELSLFKGNFETKDFAIQLYWGNWFDPTPTDLFQQEQALDLAVMGKRLYMHEARQLTASSLNIGHADPAKLEKEWPIPPDPDLPELKLEQKKLTAKGTAGDDGRDSKVAS